MANPQPGGGSRVVTEPNGSCFTVLHSEFATSIIGNPAKTAFTPTFLASAWNDEGWFSFTMPRSGDYAASYNDVTGEVAWNDPVLGHGFRTFPILNDPRHERGTQEFEIILTAPPIDPTLDMPYAIFGLEAFWQPPLTQWELDRGNIRPDDVVNSIAFYSSTRVPMHSSPFDGDKYQSCKAFHLYRPLATDDLGNTHVVEWELDVPNGILRIIWDAWFQTAAYPVVIDPTVGYTGNGLSVDNTGDYILVGSYVSGVAGDANPGTFTFRGMCLQPGYSIVVMAAAYQGTTPYNANPTNSPKVSGDATITMTSAVMATYTVPITWTGILNATSYWIATNNQIVPANSDRGSCAYDTGGVVGFYVQRVHNNTMPATFPATNGPFNDRVTAYVTYSASGGGAVTGTATIAFAKPSFVGNGTNTPAAAVTGTATIAFTKPVLAASGTNTPAAATTGTATIAFKVPALAGNGTNTPAAARTGTATETFVVPALAGSGTHTPAPAVTGTATETFAVAALAGSGTNTPVGAVTGTATETFIVAVLAGNGTVTPAAPRTGTATETFTVAVLAGSGTNTPAPARTGTATETFAVPSLAGLGSVAAGVAISGTGTLTFTVAVLASSGTVVAAITGTGAEAFAVAALAATGIVSTGTDQIVSCSIGAVFHVTELPSGIVAGLTSSTYIDDFTFVAPYVSDAQPFPMYMLMYPDWPLNGLSRRIDLLNGQASQGIINVDTLKLLAIVAKHVGIAGTGSIRVQTDPTNGFPIDTLIVYEGGGVVIHTDPALVGVAVSPTRRYLEVTASGAGGVVSIGMIFAAGALHP